MPSSSSCRSPAWCSKNARFELCDTPPHARFSYDHPDLPADVATFDVEFCLAFVVGIGRHFAGWDTAPLEVRVRHPQPDHARDYTRVFHCPVSFDQPRNEIVFRASVLDVPQIHRDEPVAELLRQRASDLLAERESDHVLAQRVVDLVKYQPDSERARRGQRVATPGLEPAHPAPPARGARPITVDPGRARPLRARQRRARRSNADQGGRRAAGVFRAQRVSSRVQALDRPHARTVPPGRSRRPR